MQKYPLTARSFRFLAALCVLCCACATAQAQKTTEMADVMAAVAKHPQQLRSASVVGIESSFATPDFKRIFKVGAGETMEPPSRSVTWAFQGEKRFRNYVDSDNKDAPRASTREYTEIYDGKQQHQFLKSTRNSTGISDTSVTISQNRWGGIDPLQFGYKIPSGKGFQWLSEVLKSGDYVFSATVRDARFGLLHRYEKSSNINQVKEETRVWLSPRYDFLAVRSESEVTSSQKHTLTVRQLEKLEQRGDIWFPVEGKINSYTFENGTQKLLVSKSLRVNSFQLNNVPDSRFAVKLEPGTRGSDDDIGQRFRVGSKGEVIPVETVKTEEESRKRPVGWLFMISLSTLLFLGIGFLWRAQRRRSASA